MEPHEAPEKIYFGTQAVNPFYGLTRKWADDDIEYVRLDAFIEMAAKYLQEHLIDYWSQGVTNESSFIERFKDYMRGE